MQRSYVASLVVAVIAFTLLLSGIGCGGGGGGGSTGGPGDGRPSGTIFSQQIVGTAPGSVATRSLANLQVGDSVVLRSLALYTSTANGYEGGFYEDVSEIVLVAAPDVASLNGTTLTAVGPGSGTVSLTGANGVILGPITFTVSNNRTVSYSGIVRGIDNGIANPGVTTAIVRFLDSDGNTVGEVTTGPTGAYQANVPSTAAQFTVDFTALPNTFYNQFTYSGLDYTMTVQNCAAPLPAGASTLLQDAIGYRKIGVNPPPPPPPTGCVG